MIKSPKSAGSIPLTLNRDAALCSPQAASDNSASDTMILRLSCGGMSQLFFWGKDIFAIEIAMLSSYVQAGLICAAAACLLKG